MQPPSELGATEWLANLSIGYIVAAALALTAVRLVLAPVKNAVCRSIAELVESLIIAGVLVFLIIRPFFLQAFYIPTGSMEPTLLGHTAGLDPETGAFNNSEAHDHIFVDKLSYRFRNPNHSEIVVFKAELKADRNNALAENREPRENILIKRLMGVPGDTLQVKPGPDGKMRVYRNNVMLVEPYINGDMTTPQPDGMSYAVAAPLHLGPGQYFVMGDNRNNSNDGRYWGPVPRDRIIGRALFIFWPLSRIRLLH